MAYVAVVVAVDVASLWAAVGVDVVGCISLDALLELLVWPLMPEVIALSVPVAYFISLLVASCFLGIVLTIVYGIVFVTASLWLFGCVAASKDNGVGLIIELLCKAKLCDCGNTIFFMLNELYHSLKA